MATKTTTAPPREKLIRLASKTSINPVMAVETVRLTREEHERQMRRANSLRMRECVDLLGRIGVDYLENREDYPLPRADDADDYMARYVVHPLESLSDEEGVADLASEALERMRAADAAVPGGPVLFTAEE